MRKPKDTFAALLALLLDEIDPEMGKAEKAADDGLRLIDAFMRIHDPALRAAAVHFVSELAKRSE